MYLCVYEDRQKEKFRRYERSNNNPPIYLSQFFEFLERFFALLVQFLQLVRDLSLGNVTITPQEIVKTVECRFHQR